MHEIGTEGSAEALAGIGFSHVEAEELSAKTALSVTLEYVMMRQRLTVQEAAALFGCNQAEVSDALQGRLEQATLERLASWLTALGQDVEITVKPAPKARHARLRVSAGA